MWGRAVNQLQDTEDKAMKFQINVEITETVALGLIKLAGDFVKVVGKFGLIAVISIYNNWPQ
jgi:hypothetical protein